MLEGTSGLTPTDCSEWGHPQLQQSKSSLLCLNPFPHVLSVPTGHPKAQHTLLLLPWCDPKLAVLPAAVCPSSCVCESPVQHCGICCMFVWVPSVVPGVCL